MQKELEKDKTIERIGSEYMLEVKGTTRGFKKLFFYCSLCETTEETRNILKHKISDSHRLNFLDKFYPSLGTALRSRSANHKNLFLIQIFSAIHKFHSQHHDWSQTVCHRMHLNVYEEKTEDELKEILKQPCPYKPDDPFIDVLENLIEIVTDMDSEVDNEPLTSDQEKTLLKRLKSESEKIHEKFATLKNDPENHPQYLIEYREFYLKHSFKYSCLARAVDPKYFTYIEPFRKHFQKFLDVELEKEIFEKIQAIAKEVKGIEEEIKVDDNFVPISEDPAEDSECEIIEKEVEVIEVSSDDEPPAKKQKLELEEIPLQHLPDSSLDAAIMIAYNLIRNGKNPTPESIRQTYSALLAPKEENVSTASNSPSKEASAAFYNRFQDNRNYIQFPSNKEEPMEFVDFE